MTTPAELKEAIVKARKRRRTDAAEWNLYNAQKKHEGALAGKERADEYAAKSSEQIISDAGSWRTFRKDMAKTIRDHQDYELSRGLYETAIGVLRYICTRCKRYDVDELRLSLDEIARGVKLKGTRRVRSALALLQGRKATETAPRQVNGKRPKVTVRGIVDEERGGPPLTVKNGGRLSNVYRVNRAIVLAEKYLALRV